MAGIDVANLPRSSYNDGTLLVQDALPPYYEASRKYKHWNVTSVAMAPLVAVPTVVAIQEIYNNQQGNLLVVDTLFAFQLLGTAATQTYEIWAMVTTNKAAPTNAALNLYSERGDPVEATVAGGRILTAAGTTVVANGWRPWGNPQAWGTAAALPGNGWHVDVGGRLIVPFGCALCLHVAGTLATAASFHVGASIYEVPA